LNILSLPEDCFDYEACVAACARGERRALHDLYIQESARLFGVAKRIARSDALAEDIVHDAFIKIWTRAGRFDPARGTARGWIFSVTRHLALNFMRDNAHVVQVSEQSESALLAEAALDVATDVDTFEYRARSGRIYGCLEQLEPARRNCILHAYVDGLSHSEISQKVGAPLGTVKAWIKRSLVALRECMG
jgi:RNA polymerase sigma-70 factor (ECF subfamily)